MIRIENLTKSYGDSVIFKDASFTFPEKGLVAILGPSGCGKSTLLNMVAGFDSEYEGDISVHGSFLNRMNAQELCAYRRDNVGFVFQNYHLISGYTVLENVLLASDAIGENRLESEPKARDLLKKLGMSEKAEQKIENLSGGQKQRVAIARALVNNPSMIFADEPTGALDRKNSTEIMELLKTMSESRLVLVITHDKKCAEFADWVVTIEDGSLICENPDMDFEESAELHKMNPPKPALWKRAMKNFKVHFARYLAIALAISMGVLCFSMSMSSRNIMAQSIADFQEKNTAFQNGYVRVEGNEAELLEVLGKEKRVDNVYPQYVIQDVLVKVDGQSETMEEKYPMAKATEKMSYGVMPRRGENEIALSPSLAAKFAKNIQDLIGKNVEMTYDETVYQLTISGIFNASYDDFFVSSDIEQKWYQGMSGDAYSVSYDVIEFEEIVAVSDALMEKGIDSQNASSEVAAFLSTFQNLKRLFLTVSILIFAIGIFISAILLVKQQNTRFHEVGLLAALGYTKDSIGKILFYENVSLSIGSAICSGVLILLVSVISKASEFVISFTVMQGVFAICITAILILAISFIASLKLIHTEPAKALRK